MATLREIRNAMLDDMVSQGVDPYDILRYKDDFDLRLRVRVTVEMETILVPPMPAHRGQRRQHKS